MQNRVVSEDTDVSEVRTVSIIRALMMEAVHATETSVYSNETARLYIPEGSNLHFRNILSFPLWAL
jgi:hypothetical protein